MEENIQEQITVVWENDKPSLAESAREARAAYEAALDQALQASLGEAGKYLKASAGTLTKISGTASASAIALASERTPATVSGMATGLSATTSASGAGISLAKTVGRIARQQAALDDELSATIEAATSEEEIAGLVSAHADATRALTLEIQQAMEKRKAAEMRALAAQERLADKSIAFSYDPNAGAPDYQGYAVDGGMGGGSYHAGDSYEQLDARKKLAPVLRADDAMGNKRDEALADTLIQAAAASINEGIAARRKEEKELLRVAGLLSSSGPSISELNAAESKAAREAARIAQLLSSSGPGISYFQVQEEKAAKEAARVAQLLSSSGPSIRELDAQAKKAADKISSFDRQMLKASRISNNPAATVAGASQDRLSAMSRQVGNPFMVLSELSGMVSGTRKIRMDIERTAKDYATAAKSVSEYRRLMKEAATNFGRDSQQYRDAATAVVSARRDRDQARAANETAMSKGTGAGFTARAVGDFFAQNIMAGALFGMIFPVSQQIVEGTLTTLQKTIADVFDPMRREREAAVNFAGVAYSNTSLAESIAADRNITLGNISAAKLSVTVADAIISADTLINSTAAMDANMSLEDWVYQSKARDIAANRAGDRTVNELARPIGAGIAGAGTGAAAGAIGGATLGAFSAIPGAFGGAGIGFLYGALAADTTKPDPNNPTEPTAIDNFVTNIGKNLGWLKDIGGMTANDDDRKQAELELRKKTETELAQLAVRRLEIGKESLTLTNGELKAIESQYGPEAKRLAVKADLGKANRKEIEDLYTMTHAMGEQHEATLMSIRLKEQEAQATEKVKRAEEARFNAAFGILKLFSDQAAKKAEIDKKTLEYEQQRAMLLGKEKDKSLTKNQRSLVIDTNKLTAAQKLVDAFQKKLASQDLNKQLSQAKADVARASVATPGMSPYELAASILEAKQRERDVQEQVAEQRRMTMLQERVAIATEKVAADQKAIQLETINNSIKELGKQLNPQSFAAALAANSISLVNLATQAEPTVTAIQNNKNRHQVR